MVEWFGTQKSFEKAHKRARLKLLRQLRDGKIDGVFIGHVGARASLTEDAANSLRREGLIERIAYDQLTQKGLEYLKEREAGE